MIAQISPEYELLWNTFAKRQQLSPHQLEQFKQYYALIIETNNTHNLTAITDLEKVMTDHFDDSLALRQFVDMTTIQCLGDVGTGAGFPAIPLKIVFPHLSLVLIEVVQKKIYFLEMLVEKLELSNVTIIEQDWRTFLRKTNYDCELFCARASLQPEELVRIFMPSSPYQNAQLVYWASQHWEPDAKTQKYVKREEEYTVGAKTRRLIFFSFSP